MYQIEQYEGIESRGFLKASIDGSPVEILTFESGRDAANYVREMKDKIPYSLRIVNMRTIEPDSNWRDRENARFASGEYTRVPWHDAWWYKDSEHYNNHFSHISLDNPGKIAFTESDEKGAEDKQLRIRAGRYLKRYFEHCLSDHDVRHWASKVFLETGDVGLNFAKSPDDIENIYRNGPDSCMSKETYCYDTDGIHPTRVYGAGDLALAYLVTGEGGEGEQIVSCRAICWPKEKIYGRIYGDDGEYDAKFVQLLVNDGFTSGDKREFEGARILKLHCGDSYVCPYLDIHDSVSHSDCGEYLVIGGGEFDGQNECGLADGPPNRCEACGEGFNMDRGGGYIDGYGEYCESCYDYRAVFCEDCEHTVHENDTQEIKGVGLRCDSCANDYPACDDCGDRRSSDEMHSTRDGESICDNCIDDFTSCDDCGDLSRTSECEEYENNSYCDSCIDNAKESGSPTVDDENQLEIAI